LLPNTFKKKTFTGYLLLDYTGRANLSRRYPQKYRFFGRLGQNLHSEKPHSRQKKQPSRRKMVFLHPAFMAKEVTYYKNNAFCC
jgi:hypothetical protein